ncbi:hypothetical protein BDZ91DRAFT_155884 [Kalaharituber pfeilii]|nr:hypothetical protein BDZ91DRAFT_155884 [Kalaharituber pfeilii]
MLEVEEGGLPPWLSFPLAWVLVASVLPPASSFQILWEVGRSSNGACGSGWWKTGSVSAPAFQWIPSFALWRRRSRGWRRCQRCRRCSTDRN